VGGRWEEFSGRKSCVGGVTMVILEFEDVTQWS